MSTGEEGRELDALAKLRLLRSHIVGSDLYGTTIRRPCCVQNPSHTYILMYARMPVLMYVCRRCRVTT